MTAPAKERGGGEPARVGPDDTVTVWFCGNEGVPYGLEASLLADDEFDYELRDGCPTCGGPVDKADFRLLNNRGREG